MNFKWDPSGRVDDVEVEFAGDQEDGGLDRCETWEPASAALGGREEGVRFSGTVGEARKVMRVQISLCICSDLTLSLLALIGAALYQSIT